MRAAILVSSIGSWRPPGPPIDTNRARSGADRARPHDHPLDVPRHGHAGPLAADVVETARQELALPKRRPDVWRLEERAHLVWLTLQPLHV